MDPVSWLQAERYRTSIVILAELTRISLVLYCLRISPLVLTLLLCEQ